MSALESNKYNNGMKEEFSETFNDAVNAYNQNQLPIRRDVEPVDLVEYYDLCSELRAIINSGSVEEKTDFLTKKLAIMKNNMAKNGLDIFEMEQKYVLAAIPFGPTGMKLDADQIKSGDFIYMLPVSEEEDIEGLTYNYTMQPAYYFQLFPKEIQEKCCFKTPKFEYDAPTFPLRADENGRKEYIRKLNEFEKQKNEALNQIFRSYKCALQNLINLLK